MLITLSSKNEGNNANFTNFLSDTIMIPEEGLISLISASIITVDGETVLTVPDGQGIYVMCDIYNIVDYPIPAGTFTISQICDDFNNNDNSLYSNIIWIPRLEDKGDGTVTLKLNRRQGVDPRYNNLIPWYDNFGYFANYYRNWQSFFRSNSFWRGVTPSEGLPGIVSPVGGIGGDSTCAGWIGDGSKYEFISSYNQTENSFGAPRFSYLVPASINQQNYRTHEWGDFMGLFYFNTNAHQQATITLSNSKINANGTSYLARSFTERKCYFDFKVNKKLDIHLIDENNDDNIVVADKEYYPGDVFLCRTIGRSWQQGTLGGNNLGLSFKRYSNGGLQFWLPLDWREIPASGWEYNNGQGNIGGVVGYAGEGQTFNSTLSASTGQSAYEIYNLHNWGENKLGWRAGGGMVMDGGGVITNAGQFILDEYIQTAGVTSVQVEGGVSRMPNGNAVRFNRNSKQRLNLFERNLTQLLPGKTESFDTILPSLIVFSFRLDSSDGMLTHTLLGSGVGGEVAVRMTTGGGVAQIVFFDSTDTIHSGSFATINITTAVKYTFGIATHGNYQDTGIYQYKIYIMEEDGSTETLVVPANNGVNNLAPIQLIGGKLNPTIDVKDTMNGNLWDFRYYQHSEYDHIVGTTYWDEVFNGVANYTINTNGGLPATYPKEWFGSFGAPEDLYAPDPTSDKDWNLLPYDALSTFFNWNVVRPNVVNASGDNWWDFSNMNFSNNVSTHHNLRQELDVGSYPTTTLNGSGKSIIHAGRSDSNIAKNILKLFDTNFTPTSLDYNWITMPDATFTQFNEVVEFGGVQEVAFSSTDNARNINIENLPHRSADGNRHTLSKTIYQLPSVMDSDKMGDRVQRSLTVPQKIKIPFKNPGNFPINSLEVKITNEEGVEDATLVGTTNIVIEINNKNEDF